MAKPVTVEQNRCTRIVWEIEIVHGGTFDSEVFTCWGSRWYFRFKSDHCFPQICLMSADTSLIILFSATSFIETPERLHKFYYTFKRNTLTPWTVIWILPSTLTAEDANWLSGVVTFVSLWTPLDAIIAHKSIQTEFQMDYLSGLEGLSSDFNNLLVTGTKPDVMVKCGDRTIPAHTLVLSARSEVFSTMFSTDMLERRTGSVDIVDIDQPDLEQLLQYMYTGKVNNLTVENAQCLYAAANKYAVHELKNKCRVFLLENLNKENACSLLVFSDVQSDKVLKNAVIKFFVENGKLLESDAWLKFSDEQLQLSVDVYRVFTAKSLKSIEKYSSR